MRAKTRNSVFRYSFFAFMLTIVVIALMTLSFQLISYISKVEERERFSRPTSLISFLITRRETAGVADMVDQIYNSKRGDLPFSITLTDDRGEILAPRARQGSFINLEEIPADDEPPLAEHSDFKKPRFDLSTRPSGPPPRHHFNVKHKLSSGGYLVFKPRLRKKGHVNSFLLSMVILTFSLLLGIACTIIFMLISFKKKNEAMAEVIDKLKKGDLKARIEVGRFDEYSQIMANFNNMADQIERLVKSLRKTESSRKDLMRELAHDLRTPIASLRSSLEILRDKSDALSAEKKKRLLKISITEIDYFSSLVDDLLFLGVVNEPHYQSSLEEINLNEVIESEMASALERYSGCRIAFEGAMNMQMNGDRKLIARLLRNGLENACSFAESQVNILAKLEDGFVNVVIEDNGPGFSPESLKKFGHKKYSRNLNKENGERISIGLGSVIMRSIAEVHKGDVTISNKYNQGAVAGARLLVRLSKA